MYGQAELKRSEGKAKEDKQAVCDCSDPVRQWTGSRGQLVFELHRVAPL